MSDTEYLDNLEIDFSSSDDDFSIDSRLDDEVLSFEQTRDETTEDFQMVSFFEKNLPHLEYDETETTIGDDEEEDFFSENKEGGQLPDHIKDEFLEQFDSKMKQHYTTLEFERSQFDVHGISQPEEENPEMVNKALYDLDVEIKKLKRKSSNHRAKSYLLAEAQNKDFVSDRSFRLMFLRSESFSPGDAARKMLAFFDLKLELWGLEKLTKKICLSDDNEGALATLEHGHVQLLPVRDHAGRSIIFNNMNHLYYTDDGTNQMRAIWYLIMSALEDEATQKNGMVFIQYKVGKQKGLRPNRHMLWRGSLAARAIPVKFAAFHLCFEKQSLPFIRLMRFGLEYYTSQRVRVHEGSQSECIQALMSFGIPRSSLPVVSKGNITKKYHLDWLKKRRLHEEEAEEKTKLPSNSSFSDEIEGGNSVVVERVVVPCLQDVLLGRGRRTREHVGNLRYNLWLEEKIDDYEHGNRKAKREIAMHIIDRVQENGGRFLQPVETSGSWETASIKVILKKIPHDFRTIRKTKSCSPATTTSNISTEEINKVDKKRRTPVEEELLHDN